MVEATYPGANARVVADTVAAPIEQQINGVEKQARLWSHCGNDGSFKLDVVFAPGTDLNLAQVLIQNRVNLALPVLPAVVQRQGITVQKKGQGLLLLACLYSPNARYDTIYLSNYAALQIVNELARMRGVAEVTILGRQNIGVRVSIDPDRLARYGLAMADVTKALEGREVRPGVLDLLGRAADAERLGETVLKTGPAGQVVRLRDVGRLEVGVGQSGFASLDGQPTVAVAVYPYSDARTQEVSRTVRDRLTALRKNLPEGLSLWADFDFTPTIFGKESDLLLDVNLPDGASLERRADALRKCDQFLRKVPGVRDVLALSEEPFARERDQPCLLVHLGPTDGDRDRLVQAIRTGLAAALPEGVVRLRDLTGPSRFPHAGYPVAVTVSDPAEAGKVRELAEQLATRLSQDQRLTDVWVRRATTPSLVIDIDRRKCEAVGVAPNDVLLNVQTYLGGYTVGGPDRFARSWSLTIQLGERDRRNVEDLKQLRVRNKEGQMVPLGAIVALHEMVGPAVVERYDLMPALTITANPAPGVSLATARSVCERLAKDVLPAQYRLTWRGE